MATPRLLLDEDVRPLLAVALRRSGYDVVHVLDLGLSGSTDIDVLRAAVEQGRAVYTHNTRDFMLLATAYARSAAPHAGIIVSTQGRFGDLLRRLLRFLSERTAEDLRDTAVWLPE